MKTYIVTLWTTAGHQIRTIVYVNKGGSPEARAKMLRSEYALQPNRVRVEER